MAARLVDWPYAASGWREGDLETLGFQQLEPRSLPLDIWSGVTKRASSIGF